MRHLVFAQDELDRLRQQKLGRAQRQPGQAGHAGWTSPRRGARCSAGSLRPFGHSVDGTPCLAQAPRSGGDPGAIPPPLPSLMNNAVLVLTGDIQPEAAFALAQQTFGDWAKPTEPLPQASPVGAPLAPRVIAVDLAKSGQAAVAVGGRSIARDDPAYYAVEVADGVLGGGYSARLNKEIRVKRGAATAPAAAMPERRGAIRLLRLRSDPQRRRRAGGGPDDGPGARPGVDPHAHRRTRRAQGRHDRELRPVGRHQLGPSRLPLRHRYAVYGLDLGDIDHFTARTEAVSAAQAEAAAAGSSIRPAPAWWSSATPALYSPARQARFPRRGNRDGRGAGPGLTSLGATPTKP